jgi:muramoyltetrapeptide carboxypeptidase
VKLITPPPLKKGDTIGIISPSAGLAPFAMHRINLAVKYLEDNGFKTLIGKHALKNAGYVSASIKSRVDDLHSMFRNPAVKAIICTIGGNNSNQLLPYLDYKLITNNPKIFVGYSDISVLHFALQSQAGLATYYGPCLMTQFGEYPQPLAYTIQHFLKLVSEDKSKFPIKVLPSKKWTDETLDWFKKLDLKRPRKLFKNNGFVWFKKGQATGTAWGGTIPSINYLLGTKYWVKPQNSIFFLDIPEGRDIHFGLGLSEVDAYLTNLENVEVFKDISGLLIGRPYKYTPDLLKNLKEIILRVTQKYNFPILTNVDLGHTDPMITLRYGQRITIDSTKNLLCLEKK